VSYANEDETQISLAMNIEAQAAAWLRRRYFWDWSQEEQSKLDAWLNETIAHRVAFWRLKAALVRTERLAALRSAEPGKQPAHRKGVWPIAIRSAGACIVIAAVGFAAASYYQNSLEETYATPVGGREVITLGDGSHVELNTDTVLHARVHANRRTIELVRGEAFFQIRHDSAHPFVVIAGDQHITDLGTKFIVRDDSGKVEVTLVEGRARVDSANAGRAHSAVLMPGDVAVATTGGISITRRTAQDMANQLGWRNGVLIFRYTTLADAAAQFNRYNSKKLVIADSASARLTIVGTFPVDDVAAFTDVVQDIMRLRVSDRGDEIVISR